MSCRTVGKQHAAAINGKRRRTFGNNNFSAGIDCQFDLISDWRVGIFTNENSTVDVVNKIVCEVSICSERLARRKRAKRLTVDCLTCKRSGVNGARCARLRSDLQPCSPTIPSDCFNGLIVKDSNGKDITSTLVTDAIAPLKQSYTGSPEKNLPTGGAPLIFSIP